ncbi:hypothetical protein ACFQL1_22035 [Halomicroarcula sp. GCM10025709]|uniref:hypothetical protein n=1 Tax=Haloarcula TaxID=2237 RepID=UPI0024C4004C|nr:hypothetical protein [Halomicroarcula sp. YJ-61-S]
MSSEERPTDPIGPARTASAGAVESDTGAESVKCRQLRELFEDVTGTDRIVEKQESSGASRCVADDPSGATIAEYVSSMVRDDGLGETLAEPDTGSTPD